MRWLRIGTSLGCFSAIEGELPHSGVKKIGAGQQRREADLIDAGKPQEVEKVRLKMASLPANPAAPAVRSTIVAGVW
jgi:hypothetical protein